MAAAGFLQPLPTSLLVEARTVPLPAAPQQSATGLSYISAAASAACVGAAAATAQSLRTVTRRRRAALRRRAQYRGEAEEPPFEPSAQLGAMAPLGYFDPLGISKVGDLEGFRNLRAAELKHGRVAMMAAVGAVVQHYVKFPGFEAVPSGVGAIKAAPGSFGFAALVLLSGILETQIWTQAPEDEVGDFGDPLGLGMYDTEMRQRELNNGRFAMFAALGIIAAELMTGRDGVQQLGI